MLVDPIKCVHPMKSFLLMCLRQSGSTQALWQEHQFTIHKRKDVVLMTLRAGDEILYIVAFISVLNHSFKSSYSIEIYRSGITERMNCF